MKNKFRLYLSTFISVIIIIFTIGFVGVSLSLNYIKNKYIEIQIDANKRQANTLVRILEDELSQGISEEEIISKLQNSILGSEADKGFICMINTENNKLLCHPNTKMIGMEMPATMKFEKYKTEKNITFTQVIGEGKETGGIIKSEMGTEIAYMVPVEGTTWLISVHENIKMIDEEINKQRLVFAIGSIILGILLAFGATTVARYISLKYEKKIEEQYNELKILHAKVNVQKEEIETQRDNVTIQRDKILKQKQEITASIQYAKRIQNASLPKPVYIANQLKDFFILFKPRDIVSGDFYWVKKHEDKLIVAVVDCTGHGVPGAFMSMLGIAFLTEIVEDMADIKANEILNKLRSKIKNSLQQTGKLHEAKDGMDMALCVFEKNFSKMQYAGANNPVFIIRDNEMIIYKPNRMPVGIYIKEQKSFTNNEIDLQKDDRIYLFSDGYADQIGEEKNKKFMIKYFKKFLLDIHKEKMIKQKEILENKLNEWKGNLRQLDDILVVGIKIW